MERQDRLIFDLAADPSRNSVAPTVWLEIAGASITDDLPSDGDEYTYVNPSTGSPLLIGTVRDITFKTTGLPVSLHWRARLEDVRKVWHDVTNFATNVSIT